LPRSSCRSKTAIIPPCEKGIPEKHIFFSKILSRGGDLEGKRKEENNFSKASQKVIKYTGHAKGKLLFTDRKKREFILSRKISSFLPEVGGGKKKTI